MNICGRWFLPLLTLGVYGFLYFPIIILVLFSFNDMQFLSYQWMGFSLNSYAQLFDNVELFVALKNSLIVAGSAVFLSVTMGVFLVWGLFRFVSRYFPLFYVTVVVPEVVLAVGLLGFYALTRVTLSFMTLIVGHTLIGLGFVIPLLYTRLSALDRRLVEASYDLGATKWQTFRRVILPLLTPAIVSAALLVFIISLDDFLISFFCTGSSSQTLSLYIFAMLRTGISPEINALSALMLLISTILVAIFSAIGGRRVGL